MKFFVWMQNNLNAKQRNHNRTSNSSASSTRAKRGVLRLASRAARNWNNVHEEIEAEKKSISQSEKEEEPSSSDDIEDYTPEEVGKLHKELMKLLSRTKKRKFLNCPSNLQLERRISNALCPVVNSSEENKEDDMERPISVISAGRCKEISLESKTSVSHLFKKIFVCKDGFSTSPNPSLTDTLQKSRMEKLLKMMLHKKINRYLQDKKQLSLKSEEEETNERSSSSDGYKWVKTDSDFLEI
ncbi:hypothetical protein Bca52824_078889 [Brassica carinata]|uniref:Uncharacterized protein n=1 Tax=Brassica carinata TaxID=52824 RepID=A0A8X7PXK6_BRACI|nr:hypothetical protein Bca52824_078889 [Brassica carinata]